MPRTGIYALLITIIVIAMPSYAQAESEPGFWDNCEEFFESVRGISANSDSGMDFRWRLRRDENRKMDDTESSADRFLQRYRVRVWTSLHLAENMDLNFRIVGEPRYYHRPDMDQQWARDEFVINRLNLTFRDFMELPLDLVLGRQDLHFGDGWLVCEGTPLDGSLTTMFDAIRTTWQVGDENTTLDLVYLDNKADSAKRLKPINDQDTDYAEQDESGTIVYLSNKTEYAQLDGYFIHKHDSNRTSAKGVEGDTYTVGASYEKDLDDNWQFRGEVAPQFGRRNKKDLRAFGTNNRISYNFNDEKKNSIYLIYQYMSGDEDPDKYFDMLWGRDPQWTSLYDSGIAPLDSGRSGQIGNLHRINLGWAFNPLEKVTAETNYHLLFADKTPAAGGSNGLSTSGKLRGHLLGEQITIMQNENIRHRLKAEFFLPGSFYDSTRNETAMLFRYEFLIKF